jgi:insulysin
MLFKSQTNKDHPFSKFGSGNMETLKTIPEKNNQNIREELLKFYDKNYSSNIMKLVIYHNEEMDALKKLTEMFSGIKNKNIEPYAYKGDKVFINKNIFYKFMPVKNIRNLHLIFPMSFEKKYYLSKSIHYYSHLIGHESEGSLFSNLKDLGWADSLSAGISYEVSNEQLFEITIAMTTAGEGKPKHKKR